MPIERTVYETFDGKQFPREQQAREHELTVCARRLEEADQALQLAGMSELAIERLWDNRNTVREYLDWRQKLDTL